MEQPYLYYATWGEGGSPTPSILPKELQACEYLETDGANNIFYTNDGTGAFTVGPDIIL